MRTGDSMSWGRLPILIVLMLVVGVLPATAAAVDACPANLSSGIYVDLDGLSPTATDAVKCITHYEITSGTGFATYSPYDTVPRWQMAIFLARTARSLGIVLPSAATQGFSDTGDLGSAAQLAVNQIAELGITSGTSATTFSPNQRLPRWHMALFMVRLLEKAGVVLPPGSDQGFTDLAGLPPDTVKAINVIAQAGVATGTSKTTFSPYLSMPRWQMAIFLANALQVGGADPHGIKLALSGISSPANGLVIATATVTGADGDPLAGQLVDVFVATALNSDGTCLIDTDASIDGGDGGTSADCQIDWADPKTDSEGKVTVLLTHDSVGEIDTVYAWMGPTGSTFDKDTVADHAVAKITWSAVATAFQISSPQMLAFGGSAEVAVQLLSGGSPVPGQWIRFAMERGGLAVVAHSALTGLDGNAVFTYTGPADPSGDDDLPVLDTIRAFWDQDGDGIDDGAAELDAATAVTWDD